MTFFFLNKSYCIRHIVNKINDEKEKRITCTKCFFFMLLKHAQCITEVASRSCFVQKLLLKHFDWYGIKTDDDSAHKLFNSIFREIF